MQATIKKIEPENLPVYEIKINDDDNSGVELISLVDEPAINMKGMMFSTDNIYTTFKEISEDKQIIVGPALIPNMRIYREDEKHGSYYVYFTEQSIEKIVEKFNKFGSNRRINIDHSDKMVDAFIMEDWIVEDVDFDKSRMYGFDVPKGTYMIKVKIENKDFWESEVKGNGKFGFSVEGLLGHQLVKFQKETVDDEVYSSIEEGIEDLDIIDLVNIFDIFTECDDINCSCDKKKVKFATAREGLVHPNCNCDLILGEYEKRSSYIGRDGKEYPCILCDQAKKNWNSRGYFRDVFGNRYTKMDIFPYYVKR